MWYSSVMPQCSNQRTSERAQLLSAMTHPSTVLDLDAKQSFVTPKSYIYTDSHLYLPPSSCHPKHVFKAIPFGVATRLKRNCSDETFFAERTAEYKGYLLNQGYPSKLVNDQFAKASAFSRNDLLSCKRSEETISLCHYFQS